MANNKQIDSATLSTHGKLTTYNEALKHGLTNGINFTKLMDQLIDTTDPEELLSAARELSDYQLDTGYVTFPHQYSNADYYLIFMSRLLSMHDAEQVVLHSRNSTEALYHRYAELPDDNSFDYQLVENENGGAYYREHKSGEQLFYIHLERRLLRFNSRAFTNLIINQLLPAQEATLDQVNSFLTTLINFGHYLKSDYGFNVDFNILDVDNAAHFELRSANLNSQVLDRLFVTAADNHYMLRNRSNGGAEIELAGQIVVAIFNAGTTDKPAWVLTVNDPEQQISWFDVLLHFEFLRDWYLQNIDDLEIKADPLIFAS